MAEIFNLNKDNLFFKIGYCDTVSNYIVTKQTDYVTLNGSENWQYDSTNNWFYCFNTFVNCVIDRDFCILASYNACTYNYLIANQTVNGTTNDGAIAVVRNTSYNNVASFKTWLASNNIDVQFKTISSTTEVVQPSYFADYGLYHNPLIEMASEPINLFNRGNSSDITYAGTLAEWNIETGKTYTFSFVCDVATSADSYQMAFEVGGTYSGTGGKAIGIGSNIYTFYTFTVPANATKVALWASAGITNRHNIMLNKGSIALPYMEYGKSGIYELASRVAILEALLSAMTTSEAVTLDEVSETDPVSPVSE